MFAEFLVKFNLKKSTQPVINTAMKIRIELNKGEKYLPEPPSLTPSFLYNSIVPKKSTN